MNLPPEMQREYDALGLPFELPGCEIRLIDNDENWINRRQLLFTETAANEYHQLKAENSRMREAVCYSLLEANASNSTSGDTSRLHRIKSLCEEALKEKQ